MQQPECIQTHYSGERIETTIIPVGTLLYSGARDTFPASKQNKRLPNRTEQGTHYFKYFTPNLEIAKKYASLEVKNQTTSGYIGIYKVSKPLTIYLNVFLPSNYTEPFYFNTPKAYASPEAQCLCSAGFHGYGSLLQTGLDDIGLCTELEDYLELVGYMPTKSSFKTTISFGGRKKTRRTRRRGKIYKVRV